MSRTKGVLSVAYFSKRGFQIAFRNFMYKQILHYLDLMKAQLDAHTHAQRQRDTHTHTSQFIHTNTRIYINYNKFIE